MSKWIIAASSEIVKYNVDIQSNLCFDELIEVNVHEQELWVNMFTGVVPILHSDNKNQALFTEQSPWLFI